MVQLYRARFFVTAWSRQAGERLRLAAKMKGNQEAICEHVGISRTTLNRIFGGADPGEERLGLLAEAVGQSVEYLLGSGPPETTIAVPIHDVLVAAGAGKVTDRLGTPIGQWVFDRAWFEANFLGVGEIMMVRVSGDSQEPELSDGDLVAVDIDNPRLREGMHVVRLDDLLMIKRIQVEGRVVRLVSRNPLYDPVTVDLSEPDVDARFEVVGRAIWASKML